MFDVVAVESMFVYGGRTNEDALVMNKNVFYVFNNNFVSACEELLLLASALFCFATVSLGSPVVAAFVSGHVCRSDRSLYV